MAELIGHSEQLLKLAADLKLRADALRSKVESRADKKAAIKKRVSN